jgi:hypothetical protein
MLLVLGAAFLALLAVAGGAARSTADVASAAAQMSAAGRFPEAIALDHVIAGRTGLLYLLDRGDVSRAERNAQRSMLDWAAALDKAGKVDQAVAVAGAVTDPTLTAQATSQRARLLVQAAQAAAARGDFATALLRLGQISKVGPEPAITAQVAQLLPQYQVGEALALTAAGHGSDALDLLDMAAQQASGAKAVSGALPAALLAAGKEEIAQFSFKEAAAHLTRLTTDFGGSSQAREARTLLRAAQPVTGTLVDKGGKPVSGQVRLSSHFFSEPGGYLTTGPFYYSSADGGGNFLFKSIPLGGPYVLEVFHSGNWETFVDPKTGQPADPVSVTALIPVDLTFIVLP